MSDEAKVPDYTDSGRTSIDLDEVISGDNAGTEKMADSWISKPSDHFKAEALGASVEFDGQGALKRLADMLYDVGEFFINPALSHLARRLKARNDDDTKPKTSLLAVYYRQHKWRWLLFSLMDWIWASVVLVTLILCLILRSSSASLNLNELIESPICQAASKVKSDTGVLLASF